MPRCPDCNKFVSYGEMETSNVEVELDESSGEITISGELELPCGECSTPLRSLSIEETLDVSEDYGSTVQEAVTASMPEEHRAKIDDAWLGADFGDNAEITYEMDGDPSIEEFESGGGRYAKNFRGVTVLGSVTRTIKFREYQADGTLSEDKTGELQSSVDFEVECKEAASAWDECC